MNQKVRKCVFMKTLKSFKCTFKSHLFHNIFLNTCIIVKVMLLVPLKKFPFSRGLITFALLQCFCSGVSQTADICEHRGMNTHSSCLMVTHSITVTSTVHQLTLRQAAGSRSMLCGELVLHAEGTTVCGVECGAGSSSKSTTTT